MVKFIKETHQYLVDGILVPSVSTILKETLFADKYKDVPEFVLQKAAAFGTAIHDAIEHDDSSSLDPDQMIVFDRWKNLQESKNIEPVKQEQIVHHEKEYAGTFDMIAKINGEECLVDIKTTYQLDKEYLSWQLSMYAYAYGHTGKLYAVWLPKRKDAQLVEIPAKPEEQIIELLEGYNALQELTDDIHSDW